MQDSEPSLVLGGLSVWILGRPYLNSPILFDHDVLEVRAECRAPGATVAATGPFLRTYDIDHLLLGMQAMHRWDIHTVEMKPLEPNLSLILSRSATGALRVQVDITSDHMTQNHHFFFYADLTYLPGPIKQCEDVLIAFPVLGGRSYPVEISN